MAAGYYFRDGCKESGGELLGAIASEDLIAVTAKYLEVVNNFRWHGFLDCDVKVEAVAYLPEPVAEIINLRATLSTPEV